MSAEAREWVWEHSSSRGLARLILLSIADRVPDDQCVAWASVASLVERTRASRSSVRAALAKLVGGDELEHREELVGPQRTAVYRLPRAAAYIAEVRAWELEPDGEPPAHSPFDPAPELRVEALRRYGIRPVEEPVTGPSAPTGGPLISPFGFVGGPVTGPSGAVDGSVTGPSGQVARGSVTGPSGRKPAPRRAGNRPLEGSATGPQNRSEPKVNRKDSSVGTAAVTPAADWQVDPATHTWALQNGHVERLGEDGLRAADAKWRAHRSTHPPRPAAAWAADWRSWIARDPPPSPFGPPTSSHQGLSLIHISAPRGGLGGRLAVLDRP
ncbi:helix-turn-helix domain-containing protein [Streptomyces fragilis]|uniref:helix-turn-helix domain-containing protein n=1 Tax=Streptomyces fragilis TaxID=67301 RepID=UPI0024DEBCA3|nr:helix-turn-helix domain-containing protein [Streptomyces fragilis]